MLPLPPGGPLFLYLFQLFDERLGGYAGEQPGKDGGDYQVGQVGHHCPGAQDGGGGQKLAQVVEYGGHPAAL